MMHESQNAQPGALGAHRSRQPAEGQPVDEHPVSVGEAGQGRAHPGPGADIGRREAAGQAVHVDPPAPGAEPVDHSPVVDVAPGLLVEGAGDDDVEADHGHTTGPS